MSGIVVRDAVAGDAAALCEVINPIIAAGGTTANLTAWTEGRAADLVAGLGPRDLCHVAEADGRVLGFQYVRAKPKLEDDTGEIASFVAVDAAGRGVGKALAAATFAAARERGFAKIFADIRADNASGLAYYESIGFRTIYVDEARPLEDGTPVDRVAKLRTL